MADGDNARLDPTYLVQQIGGGRRRSLTPVLETPTRLRPRRRPTYADSDDVRKALGMRSKPRAASQSAAADVSEKNGAEESSHNAPTVPICPLSTSRTLPPLPSSTAGQPSSALPLVEAPVASHPSLIPSNGLTHPSLVPASRQPSPQPITSLAPVGPPSRPPSTAPLGLLDPSIVPSNGTAASGPISRHSPQPSAPHVPSRPPSTAPLAPSNGRHLLPLVPAFRWPSPQPTVPASRPPSTAPLGLLAAPSVPIAPATAPTGVDQLQTTQVHPAPPAGPRKPSSSHPLPPPSDHELPFTFEDVPSDFSTEEPITVRPSIPVTRVIPPTPQHAGSLASTSTSELPNYGAHWGGSITQGEEGEVNPDGGIEMDFAVADLPPPSTPATPSGGRRSAETQAVLDAAYVELDAVLDRVSTQVSLSQQQILDSWHKSRGRVVNGVNHWNVYQGYFKAHEEQELQRIGLSEDAPGTPTTMSRCYRKFMTDHADSWKDILQLYELAEATKSSQTISQRSQSFNRFSRKISDLLDTAANRHGFEAAVVVCGNIVNEDASLGYSHTTPGASNFWEDRCRACPDMIVGHLKAHVYNTASLNVVEEAFANDGEAPLDNAQAPSEHAAPIAVPKPRRAATAQPETIVINDSDASLDNSVDPTLYIKTAIIQLVRRRGVDATKLLGSNFPWKTLLAFFVEKGLVMEGYPYDVLMPGEKQSGTARAKGLNSLSLPQKRVLASALHAKRVSLTKVPNSREHADLVNNQSPVILEEAPPLGSHHSHGRRMFGNGTCDRMGLSRVPSDGVGTRVKKRTSKKGKEPVRYIEITDDSSPVAIKDVKPPRRLKSPGDFIEVTSDDEDASGLEIVDSHDEADVSKKRKAGSKVPSKRVAKRAKKDADPPKRPKERRDRKGKAVLSKDVVDSSDDEEILSGRILIVPSSESPEELPKARPKPRVVHPKDVSSDDVFRVAGSSRHTEQTVTGSLKKEVPGPVNGNDSTPPSPSPPPRVSEPRTSEASKIVPIPDSVQAADQPKQDLPPLPNPPAAAPPGQVGVTATGSQVPDPTNAAPLPDRQRSGHPLVDHHQPPPMGNMNGFFFPNAAFPPYFGAQPGMQFRGMGYHDGQNVGPMDMHDPYGMYRGNMIGPGVYQGTDVGAQPNPYMNFPLDIALPHLPAPPKPPSRGQ